MTKSQFLTKYIKPYPGAEYIYTPKGYIVWRTGTGGNVELLHIRSFFPKHGYGRVLIAEMLKRIQPYHSVFGFCFFENMGFYLKCGFHVEPIPLVYKSGQAAFFVQEYKKLKKKLCIK